MLTKLAKIQTDDEALNRVQDAWLGPLNALIGEVALPSSPAPSPARSVPVATLLPFAGSAAPKGFLLCDGSAVSRKTYADLFAAVGTTYGTGDGSTTFNLPDLRSRMPVGAGTGPGLSARSLAATGGEEAHALSSAELASHTHAATSTQAAHSHVTPQGLVGPGGLGWTGGGSGGGTATDSVTPAITTTISSAGSGTAHNTMPPFLAVNWIIAT